MPNRWILKTEPSVYSFDQLLADRTTRWDGVRNPQALIYLRSMRKGDHALIYHSNEGKALVGAATIASAPYADPAAGDERIVVVDVKAGKRLPREVPLAAMKADRRLADLGLIRQSRLSVMPVSDAHWAILAGLAGL
ncbi:MAG: EVE domain-containing protein [Gemmatimonadales bacterium]|nr:EVE domain-containing protein [Gemmatimonadales bacterium]